MENEAHLLPKITTMAEYEDLHRRSLADPEGFWGDWSRMLTWYHAPLSTLDVDEEGTDASWFSGGRLNACFNCVDRHAARTPKKTAILWVKNDPGQYEYISYSKLKHEVGRLANVLKAQGVRAGDRVCLYMPMIPELVYAMLACARIGAVHTIVFGGFSSESLRERILDADAEIVITANEGPRGHKAVHLKALTDAAIEGLAQVRRVLVARRTDTPVPMRAGRDLWLDEEVARQRSTCPAEWMASEDPLFILYTSGSTGKPKGVLHTTAGYLLHAAASFQIIFDHRPSDVHFCTADIGWITGHSYIVYGPLASGATTVLFESVPTFPDEGRLWEIADQLGVTTLYTAPTALRSLMAAGDEVLARSRRDTLRVLGSVGEPIAPEVWRWYKDRVGHSKAAVVDTFWQTETGGILISPLPFLTPDKPGAATRPFFGVEPVLVDNDGHVVCGDGVSGNLCIARPFPGRARTIWGDHRRFRETYFSRFPSLYFTGDGAIRDADGDYTITGRVDDVLNVSGHRLGSAEIEGALVAHESVAEAAVVGVPHPIKGVGIFAYVVLRADERDRTPDEIRGALKEQVRHAIGPIATPDAVQIVPGLPKTRSGKIMRRILRGIAVGQTADFGDTSTLADPMIVDVLVRALAKKEASP